MLHVRKQGVSHDFQPSAIQHGVELEAPYGSSLPGFAWPPADCQLLAVDALVADQWTFSPHQHRQPSIDKPGTLAHQRPKHLA